MSRRTVFIATVIVQCAAWLALFWPQAFGGDVSYVMVSGKSMEPALHTGDLVLVRRKASYDVGDAVAYRVPVGEVGAGSIVIHRITGGDGAGGFTLKGDNRGQIDPWRPAHSDVIGTQWVSVPRLGLVVARLHHPGVLGLLAAGLTIWMVLGSATSRPKVSTQPS